MARAPEVSFLKLVATGEIFGDHYHGKIPLPQISMHQGTGHTGSGPFSHIQGRTKAR